jgi:hypothetical protein
MQKDFIPYNPALALKELGFDEPCFGFYTEDKVWRPASYSMQGTNYPFNSVWPYPTAPTYSQAFTFFRKKHNLFGVIDKKDGIRFYKIEDENEKLMGVDTSFKAYEEAELACLIKLIEIVKNK